MPLLRSPVAAPSRRRLRAASLALALPALTLAGCTDDAPTAPARTSANIEVAPPVLTWVAPLGTGTADPATFDSTAAPVVEVCAWTGAACAGAPVARFTTAPVGGDLPLTVDGAAGTYEGTWTLTDARFTTRRTYRVRVFQAGVELGAVSVDAVRGRWALTRADGVPAPLQAAGALPIRFHLARASQDVVPGNPDAPVGQAVPDRRYVPRAADYSRTHPTLRGKLMSFNVLALAFAPRTTVGEVNALLAEVRAAIVGGIRGLTGSGGVLFVRVPAATHEQLAVVLDALGRDRRVATVVQDVTLEPTAVPRPNGGRPPGWTWAADTNHEWTAGAGGNWGMETIGAPQLWNLNAAVCKALRRARSSIDCSNPATFADLVPQTGVLDEGFDVDHEDLFIAANQTPLAPPDTVHPHGTLVAGIIGARFDDRDPLRANAAIGVDGVNPFASLVLRSYGLLTTQPRDATVFADREASGFTVLQDYWEFFGRARGVQVFNISLGYNWAAFGVDCDVNPEAQIVAKKQGALLASLQHDAAEAGRALPFVVAAAGNDDAKQARWSSPWTNAGLRNPETGSTGEANIIVVEALTNAPGNEGGAIRWSDQNGGSAIGGHVSAPGDAVLSTAPKNLYSSGTATSFAAPHVAGLIGYLYTLDPRLPRPTRTQNVVRELLQSSAVKVDGGASSRIDAFNAALGIDAVLRDTTVLLRLLDVDDGTPDGNRRTNVDGTDFLGEDADRDGGVGDGRVDMRDFRRWRDWLLAAERANGLSLDGSPRHPKKDVNGNSRWAADRDDENVYPRGDFNGDGVLSRTRHQLVAGVMGGRKATDLEVLQKLFHDINYEPDQLPGLVESSDLTVDAGACLRSTGAARARVRVWPGDGVAPAPGSPGRVFDVADSVQVFTNALHAAGYAVQVEALAPDGAVLASASSAFPSMPLGSDTRWAPACSADAAEYRMGTWTSFRDNADFGALRLTLRFSGQFGEMFAGWQDLGDANGAFYARIPIKGGVAYVGADTLLSWDYDGSDGRRNTVLVFLSGASSSGQHLAEAFGSIRLDIWQLAFVRTGAFLPPVIAPGTPTPPRAPPPAR